MIVSPDLPSRESALQRHLGPIPGRNNDSRRARGWAERGDRPPYTLALSGSFRSLLLGIVVASARERNNVGKVTRLYICGECCAVETKSERVIKVVR